MRDEIKNLMNKYTELKNVVKTLIEQSESQVKIIKDQEVQIAQRDRVVELLPYDRLKLVSDPSVFDQETHLRPEHLIDEEDLGRANKQLSTIFSMYGGYMQMSIQSRDEVMEANFMKLYMKQMQLFRDQVEEKDAEIETLKFITETITEEAQEAKLVAEEKIQVAAVMTSATNNQQELFDNELRKQKEKF